MGKSSLVARRSSLAGMILCALLLLPRISEAVQTIAEVRVKGNVSIFEETVLNVIRSRPGHPFDPEEVAKDIRSLYELGTFNDIRVEKTSGARGLILTFYVTEKSKIGAIVFEGNEEFGDKKLLEASGLKPNTVINKARIAEAIQAIRQLYTDKGYHLVDVRHRFQRVEGKPDETLVFMIGESEGVRVKQIHFIGNKVFSDKELRKVIQTREKGYFSWLTGRGKYQKEILERDAALLMYHYLSNGYLRVNVGAPKTYLTRDKKWLIIHFYVEEGEQYRIGTVDVEGDVLTTREELLERIKTESGEIYNRRQLDEDIQTLTNLYGNEAYAFAVINPATIPNDEALTADIIFQIQKGSKIKIEEINIAGNTTTRDKVIRRELEVVENSYYHEDRLRRSREKLLQLGFFEEVNFATPRGSSDDQLVLNIRVKEKPTGTFSIGAGFSSVENFILTASIAKDNFFGYGISGNFSLEFSSRRQLYLLSFQDPYFLDTNWIFGLSSYRTVNVFEDFDRASFGGTVTLGRRIFDYSRLLLGYEIEDVEARDFTTIIPAAFEDKLSGLTSSFTLNLSRDTRNNRLYPSEGTFLSVENQFSGAGGDNRFYRVTGNARFYETLFWDLILKTNFTIGYIKSLMDGPIPLFERYYAGGINSLRGYTLRSVGPKVRVTGDPAGADTEFLIGGNKLLLMNLELEYPLVKQAGLSLVAFFDAGDAFAENENYNLGNLRLNYGFGLRWNSPFGPMRFEWGLPINRRADEDPVIFNFSIGSFF